MYQRSYPFPGFRQTGACPQHGAFYGHGACFQPPQNQPAAESLGVFGNPPTLVNPAATALSPSAQHVPVSNGTNTNSSASPANVLSARAETFVPISAQDTISSVGDSDPAKLKNRETGRRLIVHQDAQPERNHLVRPNAPGQAETSRNTAPMESGLASTVRHKSLANIKGGRNPTVLSNPFVQNISPKAAFQPKFPFVHQSLFPHVDQDLTNVKFLVDGHKSYRLRFIGFVVA